MHVGVVFGFYNESLREGIFKFTFLFMLSQFYFFVADHLSWAVIGFSSQSL